MARSFKRQFQPSINSYFRATSDNFGGTVESHGAEHALSDHFPALPATIQSTLLNVGMRVRKSVPEGYQTRTKASRSFGPSVPNIEPSPAVETAWSPPSRATPAHHGLVPYCGILKIGGLAVQPVPAEADLPPLQFDDEFSLPSSSQGSDTSVVTRPTEMTPTTSPVVMKKRRREDADGEDLGLESQPVSPRSRPISHTCMPNLNHIRPIARPKSRKKLPLEDRTFDGTVESEMIDVEDFGEAPFFRPEDWETI